MEEGQAVVTTVGVFLGMEVIGFLAGLPVF
jgi:hypothetical protein